jgi:hypothetical protein
MVIESDTMVLKISSQRWHDLSPLCAAFEINQVLANQLHFLHSIFIEVEVYAIVQLESPTSLPFLADFDESNSCILPIFLSLQGSSEL